jgi:hypothetical protein
MELKSKNENKENNNSLVTRNEIISLVKNDFFMAMDKLSSSLKEDIQALSISEKEKSKDIIEGFNRQLEFIESYKTHEDISQSMKEKIYDDFIKVSNELGRFQITIYKSHNDEKAIKLILGGVVDTAKIITAGAIVIALIKKIK